MALMKAQTQLDNGSVREVLDHTALLSLPIVSLPLTGSFPVMSPNHEKPPTRLCTDQPPNASFKSLHEAEGGPKQWSGNKKGASFPPLRRPQSFWFVPFTPFSFLHGPPRRGPQILMQLWCLRVRPRNFQTIKMSKHWPSFLQTDINCLAHIRAHHIPSRGLRQPTATWW